MATLSLSPRIVMAAPPAAASGSAEHSQDARSSHPEEEEFGDTTPTLVPPADLSQLAGKPVGAVEIKMEGDRWLAPTALKSVAVGAPFTPAVARRAARELVESGRYARVSVTAELSADSVVIRLLALPRRLVAKLTVEGGRLDDEALLEEAHLTVGSEVTAVTLPRSIEQLKGAYARRGYRQASAAIDVRETDDPMRVAIVVQVDPGLVSVIAQRSFVRDGPQFAPSIERDNELADLEQTYALGSSDRADEERLTAADRALTERLRAAHYYKARVQHQLVARDAAIYLFVRVDSGPKYVTRYEGLHSFDAADLDQTLDLDRELDHSLHRLEAKLVDFYVRRGFLDVEVTAEERGGEDDPVHLLFFLVREHPQVRVTSREFPCASGNVLSTTDAARDIDSFLEEELPGGGLLQAVDPAAVDALSGPHGSEGARPVPLDLEPRATYVAEVYDRAQKHLQDYYRSQGYLSATVGPLELVRRQCDRHSPAGQCIPLPLPVAPKNVCLFDPEGLPLEEPPPDPRLLCIPDPGKGISCEPRLALRIPVKLGPRTTLYDLSFEGNKTLVDTDLAERADLELGGPVSQTEVEAARKRVLDALREDGFAFAEVRALLDFSADRTRARARFLVAEGERVYVDGIVIRGAKRTNPSLILRRVSFLRCPRDRRLDDCEPYRASDIRKSEERIASLGTFSSVSISLEDPQVPARRKVVLVDVQESIPQYLDLRPGFSTGEGFRGMIEYGHRNLGGAAIQLTLRAQLSYLPDAFIVDQQVRDNWPKNVAKRLERRDTVSIVFPEVGLGPLFRLGLDGVDVRDNARDFGLSKEAAVATLTYRPVRSFYAQIGGSLEVNDVEIFGGATLDEYLRTLAPGDQLRRLLLVPEGLTFAVAERISATWDRRDNPFSATRGTLLVAGVEHVHAYPAETNLTTSTSDFLRLTATAAGYVRLNQQGLAIAVSVKGGRIVQLLSTSKTYPDRLFFLGGVDSIRGFLQDSLVPQDLAAKILTNQLSVDNVAIRGGDVFINPRFELRIPIVGVWEGGLFLDTGNLWVEPSNFDPFKLRYAAGAGIRIATPIGPIAFDYGINLIKRDWEQRGNFHFAIGLF